MRTFCKTALTVAAVVLLAGPALAQRPGQGRGFAGGRPTPGAAALLANKSVQEELKLTADETEKLSAPGKKLREKQTSMFGELRNATQEKRLEKMKELADAGNAANEEAAKLAKDTLKADQLKRLGQIELQVKHETAFAEEAVEKALTITAAQKDEIKKLRDDATTKIRALQMGRGRPQGGQGQPNRQENQAKIQALHKEAVEKVVAELTDSQKKHWKEMVGSPFEYKPDSMRGQ